MKIILSFMLVYVLFSCQESKKTTCETDTLVGSVKDYTFIGNQLYQNEEGELFFRTIDVSAADNSACPEYGKVYNYLSYCRVDTISNPPNGYETAELIDVIDASTFTEIQRGEARIRYFEDFRFGYSLFDQADGGVLELDEVKDPLSAITNERIKTHAFLSCLYSDSFYPPILVDKFKFILLDFCKAIEWNQPGNLEAVYQLSHLATEQINDLEDEFFARGSEIETVARECLAYEFGFIASAYGFDADVERLIAPRNW